MNYKLIKVSIVLVILCSVGACMSHKDNALVQLLSQRYSGYFYDPDRTVAPGHLKNILTAGQLAVSSYNDQPWRFIVCDRTRTPEAYQKVIASMVPFNQKWAQNAPVLIVVIALKNSHKGQFNRWAEYDSGAAAMAMMLAAAQEGLMAHQLGGFDVVKLASSFELPEDALPMAIMAVGYDAVPEPKKKERRPLQESFFLGGWKSVNPEWQE